MVPAIIFFIIIIAAIISLLVYQSLTDKFIDKTVDQRIKAIKEETKTKKKKEKTSIMKSISDFVERLLPLNRTDSEEYRFKLGRAGLHMDPNVWRTIVILCILVGTVVGVMFIMPNDLIPLPFRITGVIVTGLIGYLSSKLYLHSKIKERRQAIEMDLPNALELLSVTVSAGSPVESGFRQVAIHTSGPVAEEFRNVDKEINLLGYSREEALTHMSNRCQSKTVSTFCSALIQAEQQGTSIVRVLKSQAKIARDVLDSAIAEKVHKLPTQMSIPLAGFFLPAIVLIIMIPIIIELIGFFGSQNLSSLSF